jgi:hypothetical protein
VTTGQVCPPSISRAKFDREVEAFRNLEAFHRQNGRLLVRAEFPVVELLFLTPHAQPRLALFAVRVDFTNYDVDPPSLRFIDIFSGGVLNIEEIGEGLLRLPPETDAAVLTLAREGKVPWPAANMVQGYPGQPAFLCMPGIREYHENPGHTGDSWLLHRCSGEGRLHHIATTISRYGTDPVVGLGARFQVNIVAERREVPA